MHLKPLSERLHYTSPSLYRIEGERIRLPINHDILTVRDFISDLIHNPQFLLQGCGRLALPRKAVEHVVYAEASEQSDDIFVARVSPSRPRFGVVLPLIFGQLPAECFFGARKEHIADVGLQSRRQHDDTGSVQCTPLVIPVFEPPWGSPCTAVKASSGSDKLIDKSKL
ncbi:MULTISPECIES: hypothetical protein [unclassified Roseovarius]|uniref:hypothetical protein n=1 Tax=unclassified Roseovarius TaxID=2614913 RepID=UPI00125EEEF4|nr:MULTISPECIES: hypothetical protein [unclassified Roseovarius]